MAGREHAAGDKTRGTSGAASAPGLEDVRAGQPSGSPAPDDESPAPGPGDASTGPSGGSPRPDGPASIPGPEDMEDVRAGQPGGPPGLDVAHPQVDGSWRAQRELWGDSGWRRWVLASSFARLGGTMAPFALLLAGEQATGAFSQGAWMASGYAMGMAVAAPFRGRTLDQRRLPGGLRNPLLAQAAVFLALALACFFKASLWLLLPLSVAGGVVPAGVVAAYRALLPALVPRARLEAAFAIDAVLMEVQWILGPSMVGMLALADATLGVGAIALTGLSALALNLFLPDREPAPGPRVAATIASLAPFFQGLPRLLYLSSLAVGVSWGVVDAALPPRLLQVGSRPEAWGGLTALLSAASAVGGLLYTSTLKGRVTQDGVILRRCLLFLALWGVLLVPLALVANLWALGAALAAAGIFLAPQAAMQATLLQRKLPDGRQAEGFSLSNACFALGLGLGSGLVAVLLETAGPHGALLTAGALPVLVALWGALVWRSRL
ncbi:MFS transporter [Corallococcus sp. bb12-1]|uniref:MFS transporter n=1 Tax=Corallococcus sp. bb12-1 TaxID=2996784 RepID=UPI00226DE4D4|nr:MFS transporter [Corallococcus sp. bb12-1]MCY1046548.1 MFS transporter [Corallococcus sp. bb12-1]